MANPNPKLENLNSYKPKWKSGKTRTIRVPVAIAERVLKVAHQIDEGKLSDTSEYIPKDKTVAPDKDEIKRLKSRIKELEQKLISVTSDNKSLSSPSQSKSNSNKANITDTSKSFDKAKAKAIISEGLSYDLRHGGKIKVSLAQLGNLIGFKIGHIGKRWIFNDTSETSDMKEIGKIISEGLSAPSKNGSKIKAYLAQIGNLLGFKIERKGKYNKWVFTDTSD